MPQQQAAPEPKKAQRREAIDYSSSSIPRKPRSSFNRSG